MRSKPRPIVSIKRPPSIPKTKNNPIGQLTITSGASRDKKSKGATPRAALASLKPTKPPAGSTPAFYTYAASTVSKCRGRVGTPHSLVLGAEETRTWSDGQRRRMFAVVMETLKYYDILESLLSSSSVPIAPDSHPIRASEQTMSSAPSESNPLHLSFAVVLSYDLLIGKNKGNAVGSYAGKILGKWKVALLKSLGDLMGDRGVTVPVDLLRSEGLNNSATGSRATAMPRDIRINTLVATLGEILADLKREGWEPEPSPPGTPPYMIRLPPTTPPLHAHPFVTSGRCILQSLSSSLTAHALQPQPGWLVVDACAAPGNKTTQLAALVAPPGSSAGAGAGGRVVAVERDPKRAVTLRRMVAKAHASAVVSVNEGDFLGTDVSEAPWSEARAVLVDPSCSGSGLVGREEWSNNEQADAGVGEERLRRLADFQFKAVTHAMTFPSAVRLAYSTCSIHAIENEQVVARCLTYSGEHGLGWQLQRAIPEWRRRGVQSEGLEDEQADCCVRADPEGDRTTGFFVAVFVRTALLSSAVANEEAHEKKAGAGRNKKLLIK
ncbi:S-adenosyl-L-methionine-dependent methyltransferase [Gonapodya prolifera JEL478]|uniref:S-adenosyl-L-methionine-dependent methyltransferase n=1 Tax=Gonapodya prolifera (strain JEL478) TaxID=1344416 RepID=A0A139ABS7_GONPJ|nr:S-adenosyl-L-methionine-dependent methyltransferase [Gonapodya prolifera JEL478]|eukprot:KXS14220.1 S-adenosyl-L-methionine-dependent methyltransferase [Gonapodya prolifera JEL478]